MKPDAQSAITSQEGLDDWLGRVPGRLREFTLCLLVGRAVEDWVRDEQWPPDHPFVQVARRTVELAAACALMPQPPGDALVRKMTKELYAALSELADGTITRVADVLVACVRLMDVVTAARPGTVRRASEGAAVRFAVRSAEHAIHAYPPDPARWQREREVNIGLASRIALLGEQAETLLRLGHALQPELPPMRLLEWSERVGDAGLVACDLIAERGWTGAAIDEVRRLMPPQA